KIWDHAGGILVVQEAGGRVSDIHGRVPEFHHGSTLAANEGMVVTNGPIHDAVLAAVAQHTPQTP
ncbi:MAG: 3'(2'),5'-bisphosphate nucleotidase, partial [Planctomycetaceae bacterium]|nr:3'(2'),5'-bisphosphate nucleotidase [Planctomycetaceae bacterium]